VKSNTKGWEQPIDTRFDVVERGQYTVDITAAKLPSTTADPKTPNDLLQARNAVAIAQAEGGDRYAADTMRKAEDFLARAEDYLRRKQSGKAISTVARGATQAAEDARVLTLERRQQEQQDAERTAMRERAEQAQQQEAEAKAQAEQETLQREQADRDRQTAEQARADADRARQEAEAAKADALAQQQAAQSQAQQAEQARLQAEQEKEQARARLLQQLNQVLQTRESARGLIVDMPDVLFDTGKYTLKPGARERLAKVAGILMAYPDLHVQVEGHTDNVGGVDFNQHLSEKRASAVRDFLVQQGVKSTDVESRGFGMDQPVATNSTATGRQLNRRVDLVVTGQAIGTTAGTANPAQPATSVPNVPAGTVNRTQPANVPPSSNNPQANPATPPNNQPQSLPPQ
jgi:outer membrane protein OmpA-like peptidoglycan-associated protein